MDYHWQSFSHVLKEIRLRLNYYELQAFCAVQGWGKKDGCEGMKEGSEGGWEQGRVQENYETDIEMKLTRGTEKKMRELREG